MKKKLGKATKKKCEKLMKNELIAMQGKTTFSQGYNQAQVTVALCYGFVLLGIHISLSTTSTWLHSQLSLCSHFSGKFCTWIRIQFIHKNADLNAISAMERSCAMLTPTVEHLTYQILCRFCAKLWCRVKRYSSRSGIEMEQTRTGLQNQDLVQ